MSMFRVGLAAPMMGLFLLASGCQQAPPPAPDTRAADEQAIRDLEAEWSKAAGAKDLERFVSYYGDDATVFPQGEPGVSGRPAIRASIEKMFAMPGFSLSFETTKVEVARSGDLAYSHGTFSMSMTGPKKSPVTDKGKYVTVFRKQADGQWKVVADIFNSDQPAPK